MGTEMRHEAERGENWHETAQLTWSDATSATKPFFSLRVGLRQVSLSTLAVLTALGLPTLGTQPSSMEVDIEDSMGLSPVHFLAGAVAGTAEHCGMYPIDTIKVREFSCCFNRSRDSTSKFGSSASRSSI